MYSNCKTNNELMNLQKAYQSCLENDGVTYNLNGELNPDHGFMVATGAEESHSSISPELVADYVERHAVDLADPRKYLGIWFEEADLCKKHKVMALPEEDGTCSTCGGDCVDSKWVFDVSEIFEEKRQALFFGIIRNQRAIWDNKNKKAITVK